MNLLELTIVCILGLYAVDALPNCAEDNFDVHKVAKALERGISKQWLLGFMERSAHELTPDRMDRIRALIEDAYLYQPAQAEEWWSWHTKDCPEERET